MFKLADQDDVEMMPPLPPSDGNDHEIPPPPLPADEPLDHSQQRRPPEPQLEDGEVSEDMTQNFEFPAKTDHRLPTNNEDQKGSNGANEMEDIKR